MNMKKTKIMSAIAVLAATIPMTVSAAPQTTDINATVKSTYVLTIPAATSIIYGQESTDLKGSLKVSGNVDTNEKVKVSVATTPLHNDSHNEDIVYTLNNGNVVFQGAEWSEAELRSGQTGSGKEIQLSVGITKAAWEAAKAGEYKGAITFTATLEK